jgi:hypothetical protein
MKKVFDYRRYVDDITAVYILYFYKIRLKCYKENCWEYHAQGKETTYSHWGIDLELYENFTIDGMIEIVEKRIRKLERKRGNSMSIFQDFEKAKRLLGKEEWKRFEEWKRNRIFNAN